MAYRYYTLTQTDMEQMTPQTRAEVESYVENRNNTWAPLRSTLPSPYSALTIQPVPWPADQMEAAAGMGGLLGTPPGSPSAVPVPSVPMARTDGPPRRRVILNPEEDDEDDEEDNEWTNQMQLEATACRRLLVALPAVRPPPSSDHLKEMENTLVYIQMNNLEENPRVAPRMAELRSAIADMRLMLLLININNNPNHLGTTV
jgi:hypothetical protein